MSWPLRRSPFTRRGRRVSGNPGTMAAPRAPRAAELNCRRFMGASVVGWFRSPMTASQTPVAARESAAHVRPDAALVDLNRAPLNAKMQCAALVEEAGGHYLEAAITASVPQRHRQGAGGHDGGRPHCSTGNWRCEGPRRRVHGGSRRGAAALGGYLRARGLLPPASGKNGWPHRVDEALAPLSEPVRGSDTGSGRGLTRHVGPGLERGAWARPSMRAKADPAYDLA
jgi:hypothetical protein